MAASVRDDLACVRGNIGVLFVFSVFHCVCFYLFVMFIWFVCWIGFRTIQKIITLPAALQRLPNPVPRVVHPDWMVRLIRERGDSFKQTSISSFFKPKTAAELEGS